MKNVRHSKMITAVFFAIVLFFNAPPTHANDNQAMVDRIAGSLALRYEFQKGPGAMSQPEFFKNMQACQKIGASFSQCYKTQISLTNGKTVIPATDTGWKLYYNDAYLFLEDDSKEFDVAHVNGGLYVITPTADFKGFKQGETKVIEITAQYNRVYISDFYPRAFVAADGAEAKVIPNTNTEDSLLYAAPILTVSPMNWMIFPPDNSVLATATTREADFAPINASQVSQTSVDSMILPTPRSQISANGSADLSQGVALDYPKTFPAASKNEIELHLTTLGVTVSGKGAFKVTSVVNPGALKGFGDEYAVSGGYQLTIEPTKATVVGYDNAGIFYGLQSVASLIQADFDQGAAHQTIPTMTVTDSPRFEYRGLQIDSARNFVSVTQMKKLIRALAAYKGNKLHLHLSDNEGWRVEINGLPELTDVGGKRLQDNDGETKGLNPALGSGPDTSNLGSGYYTIDDYQSLVQLANANFIQVIPEIDMPAHIRAGIFSMEARYKKYAGLGDNTAANEYRLNDPADTSRYMSAQFYNDSYLNPCQVSTFNFINKVITELSIMHAAAGQPLTLYHAGGDEVRNIFLGPGFQNVGGSNPIDGWIDLSLWDQPWSKSPACNNLALSVGFGPDKLMENFFINVSSLVKGAGVNDMILWNDGANTLLGSTELSTSLIIDNWDSVSSGMAITSTAKFLNGGHEIIIAPADFLYFDAPYEIDPAESGTWPITRDDDTQKVYSFAAQNLPQNAETAGNELTLNSPEINGKGSILGIEGNLWGELMRTDVDRDKFAFPRMLAMLERAWHKASWELEYEAGRTFSSGSATQARTFYVDTKSLADGYAEFASLLGKKELAKLDKMQVRYRVPIAGGVMTNGKLTAYAAFPGLTVQYQAKKGGAWTNYDANNQPTTAVAIRTLSALGNRPSRAVPLQ